MKKILLYSLLTVGVVSLVGVGIVSAQGSFFDNHGMNDGHAKRGYENMLENKAEIFGLSVEDLKVAKEEGKTFCEIVEEQGLDLDEFRAQIQGKKQEQREQRIEQIQTHLNQLVANGEITQEQADNKIQRMQERFENFGDKGNRNGGAGRFMNCQQSDI